MPIKLNEAVKSIREFSAGHNRPPSVEEIRKVLGYRSKAAAAYLIQRLIDKDLLTKDKTGRLTLSGMTGVKLLGSVQAGWPSPAEEELVDMMSLDEYLIKHPEQTFMVKVSGDSMIDE